MQVGNRVLMVCIRNAERLLTLRSSDAAGLVWVSSTAPSPLHRQPRPRCFDSQRHTRASLTAERPGLLAPPDLLIW